MNIFEDYLIKIKNTIKKANQDDLLELPENLSGINVDIPPAKFNGDVSTNVEMVLSKINKKPPIELAEIISGLLKKNDINIDHITITNIIIIENIKFNIFSPLKRNIRMQLQMLFWFEDRTTLRRVTTKVHSSSTYLTTKSNIMSLNIGINNF